MELFKTILELYNTLLEMPDNSSKELEIAGMKVIISKSVDKEEFDDSEVKEIAGDFKESIAELDDEIFEEAKTDISEALNINRLSSLLDSETFTEEEANELIELVGIASNIISDKLQEKIQELIDLLNKF